MSARPFFRRPLRRLVPWLAALLTLCCLPALAADEEIKADPVVEARMVSIADELRCLVCQNESLSASRADLAKDLRREIRGLIQAGKSDQDILDFMVDRYGDFVRYRPPFKASTALLWLGPALFVLMGIVWLRRLLAARREPMPVADAPTPAGTPMAEGNGASAPRRPPYRALAVALPVLSLLTYLWLGTPAALNPLNRLPADDPAALDRMVAQLAAKLEKQPDNPEGWLMLARSYRIQGDHFRAADAFARAGAKAHGSAALLAEYAEVLASRDGSFAGQAGTLLSEALGKDPDQPQALFLAGAAAAERGDVNLARELWQRLLPQAEAGSEAEAVLKKALAQLPQKKPGKGAAKK